MGWARTSPSQSDALGFKIISFRSIRTTILNEVGIPVSRNNSCINYSFSWIVSNLIIKIIPRAGPGWCLGSREHPSTFPTGAPSPSRGGTQEEPWAHTFRRAAVDGAPARQGPRTQRRDMAGKHGAASQSGGGHRAGLLSTVAHRQQSEAGPKKHGSPHSQVSGESRVGRKGARRGGPH